MTGTAVRADQHPDQKVPTQERSVALVAAVHRNRRAALAIAAVAGFLGGWLTALITPRGPTTPGARPD